MENVSSFFPFHTPEILTGDLRPQPTFIAPIRGNTTSETHQSPVPDGRFTAIKEELRSIWLTYPSRVPFSGNCCPHAQ